MYNYVSLWSSFAVISTSQDHDGHGPQFLSHMNRINGLTGANITVSLACVCVYVVYLHHIALPCLFSRYTTPSIMR